MRLLDQNTLTTQINKIVETPLGLIINGCYYFKDSFIPKPLQLFPVVGNSYDLATNQRLMLEWSPTSHGKSQGDTICTDRYDTTITYAVTTGARTNIPMIFKIRENNGVISILNSVSIVSIPAANPFVRCYCGQDTNSVYYIFDTVTTFHEYFVKIDKTSLTMTVIEDMASYTWGNLIKETDTFIYYNRKSSYGTNFIKRYNKTTSATDIFTTIAKTSNIYFYSNFSNLLSNSDTNFYTYSVFHNQSTNKFGITRYTYDTTQTVLTSIVAEADCNITWGTITQLPVFASNTYLHYESFITSVNSKNYLTVAIWESGTNATPANLTGYGLYTFLIDPTTHDLTFKSFVQPSADYFRGYVGIKSNSFLVCATPTTCYFMNFDVVNEKFVVTDSLVNQPYFIGADASDNIYIVDVLYNVEMLTAFTPTYVAVLWEMTTYNWLGTNISTFCTAEARNMSGIDIACNLVLTIKGSAVFTSNGSKTINITTLTTGALQVPITINGNITALISTQFTS